MPHTRTTYKLGIDVITPDNDLGAAADLYQDNDKAIADKLETHENAIQQAQDEISLVASDVEGKANTVHTHVITDVDGLDAALAAKANTTTFNSHIANNDAHGATDLPTVSTIVKRDVSGNIFASAVVASDSLQVNLVSGESFFLGNGGYSQLTVSNTSGAATVFSIFNDTTGLFPLRVFDNDLVRAVNLTLDQGANVNGQVECGGLVVNGSTSLSGGLNLDGNSITNAAAATFSGVVTASSFSGSGASLTSLPAANLTGSIPDARLSSNVALKNANNNFSVGQTITGTVTATTFSGSGASLTALNATNISTGTLNAARLPATAAKTDTTNSFTAAQTFDAVTLNTLTLPFTESPTSPGSLIVQVNNVASSNYLLRLYDAGCVAVGGTSSDIPAELLTVYGDTTISGNTYVGGNFDIGGSVNVTSGITSVSELQVNGPVGFFGTSAIAKQMVSGSTEGNVALQHLIAVLASYGLIDDGSS